jgi:hypothetical protein
MNFTVRKFIKKSTICKALFEPLVEYSVVDSNPKKKLPV